MCGRQSGAEAEFLRYVFKGSCEHCSAERRILSGAAGARHAPLNGTAGDGACHVQHGIAEERVLRSGVHALPECAVYSVAPSFIAIMLTEAFTV